MKSACLILLSTLHFVLILCNAKDVNFFEPNSRSAITEDDGLQVFFNSTTATLNKTNVTEIDLRSLTIGVHFDNKTYTSFDEFEEQFEQFEERKHCLQNLTNCIEEDTQFRILSGKLSKLLFTSAPSFDLSKVIGISQKCLRDSAAYQRELQKFALWALRMYDSTAKLPSGILNGNVNQYGDFDQCLSVNGDQNIRGKYCLAYMQVEVPHSLYMTVLHDLVYSHLPFRSRLSDPGHRVPRISSINWGLCVPHACSFRDVELGVQQLIADPLSQLGMNIEVEVKREMCQTNSDKVIPISSIIVGIFFIGVIMLAVAATIYDFRSETHQSEYLMAFSLKKNITSLISLKRSEGDIASVHGIRFLNAIMLIMAHKSMALFFNPYINRTEMAEFLGRPWSVLGRAASLYTDPFIMFSGMLTTYSFLGRLNRNQDVNVFKEYVSRLMRLVPTLGALILFCTFILPWLGSGPQWPLVIDHHAEICKETWWRNLLFIHNYYGFKNMCLTHTHHVGIDTQLFAFSPLMIFLIWRWPRRGISILITLATVSTLMRYYVTYSMRLSNYVHFGTSIKQLFETADNMYILPAHRLTVYIMGIFLAYLLRNAKKLEFSQAQVRAGDALALLSFCVAFFGPAFMSSIGYKYNPTDAAWYAAFAPIAWCFSFAWIIYTAHFGYDGYIGKIFSWKGFLVSTRLSYAIYLTQFPVFFYNVGVTRSSEQYTFIRMQVNLPELANILFFSVLLTVLFDTPFQNIKNILFKKKTLNTCVQNKEEKVD
ncbi:drop dead [Carabus blaptoides fortunei]